ncbi:alpha/beta fold hydrolase [Roseococcus sp. YIM B11640]|uniref:alpha/beta fold hydrolase n=1 Tax=Roseococcus sp. YIM B11640 TaxID=3133973 RepID=UPI003C7A8463
MRFVETPSGKIATQSFGSASDPALLLVMGATASMLGWPEALCAALVNQGFHVVRFDHRDTGRSITHPPGEATYSVEDMADDVVAIMDAYGFQNATIMGMSLGGYVAQMVALDHSQRVNALVLVSSEPLGWDGPALPHISQRILDHFGALSALDWSDRTAVGEFLLEIDRLSAGTYKTFDEAAARAKIEEVLDRTDSPASMFNHAMVSTREDWTGRFRDISCKVLVVHGAEDPVLPIDNGQALAEGIVGARFMVLDRVGHEIPDDLAPQIAESVARHVRRTVQDLG